MRSIAMALIAILGISGCARYKIKTTAREVMGRPSPKIVLDSVAKTEIREESYTQYRLSVTNWEQYPKKLFEAAPGLPRCGLNWNASRTWVNIYDERRRALNGFCAFSTPESLSRLWFAIPPGKELPTEIYVEIKDRRDGILYRSDRISADPESARGRRAVHRDFLSRAARQPRLRILSLGTRGFVSKRRGRTKYNLRLVNWEELPAERKPAPGALFLRSHDETVPRQGLHRDYGP